MVQRKKNTKVQQIGFSLIEVVVVVVILAVLSAGWYLWQHNLAQPKTVLPKPGTPQFSRLLQKDLISGPLPSKGVSPAPKLNFASYVLAKDQALPSVPAQVKVYALASNLTPETVKKAPVRLGLKFDSNLSNPDAFAFTNLSDRESLGYFVIDPRTGGFEFQSYGQHAPSQVPAGATPTQIAESFLKEAGLWDKTLKTTATYQREGQPFTFVEIHRDWESLGLPILSSIGVLNVPAAQSLSGLKVGQGAAYLPEDPSIINTSDNTDGRKRPNDFNTLTVTITPDGRVWGISSNLRPLAKTNPERSVGKSQLKTPSQALNELGQGEGLFGFSAPAGEGQVDLAKVYPNNLAKADQAVITDFELIFLEKPAGVKQAYLQPVYLFRGQAKLKSGYTVNWSQVVPAVKEVKSTSANLDDLINPAYAQATFTPTDSGLFVPGLGSFVTRGAGSHTFYFQASALSSQELTVSQVKDLFYNKIGEQYVILVARALQENSVYLSQINAMRAPTDLYPLFARLNGHSLSAYQSHCWGTGTYMLETAPIKKPENPNLMCFKLLDDRVSSMTEKVANTILAAVQTALPSSMPRPTSGLVPTATPIPSPEPTQPIYQPFESAAADTYSVLTLAQWAVRPNIFGSATLRNLVYAYMVGTKDSDRMVGSGPNYISGESPYLFFYQESQRINPQKAGLRVTLPPATTYHEDFADPIYYEYDAHQVKFTLPKEGWVVKTSGLQDWVASRLVPQFGLNAAETKILQLELERFELGSAPYVKISLLAQTQLNQQLPLRISPRPDRLYRVNLLLQPLASFQRLPQPQVTPIKRSGLTVVEVGAYWLR